MKNLKYLILPVFFLTTGCSGFLNSPAPNHMNSVLYTDHSSTIGGLNDKDSEMKDDGTYDNGNLVKVNTLNDDGFSNYKNQNELENKKTSNENIENNNNNSNTVSYEHSTPKDVLIGGSLDSLPYNSSICHDRLLCLTF